MTVWLANPTMVRRLRRISLIVRKQIPATRALRKSVHRAYRRAGLKLPKVSR